MRIHTLVICLFFLFTLPTAWAVTLSVSPSAQSVTNGQTFSTEVQITDFTDIIGFQFSMSWDPAVLQFQSVTPLIPGMTAANFNTVNAGAGVMTVLLVTNGTPYTLPDGTALFAIQFQAVGATGALSNIMITGTPTPIAVYNAALQNLPVTTAPGATMVSAQAGFSISGNIHRASGAPVPDVLVGLSGDVTGNDLTGAPGDYLFSNIPAGSNGTITPSKSTAPLECVSVRDLLFIYKHILGITPLGSPYQMVAADVNGSFSITTFDAVELRKLILGIYPALPNRPSWQFIPASFVFPNPNNPFSNGFPQTATFTNLQADVVEDFIGIKTGDATDCSGDTPGPAFLTLSAQHTTADAGQTASMDVTAQGFSNVSGLQFSIQWDPAVLQFDQVNNFHPGLTNLSASFNTAQAASGKISVCWLETSTNGVSVPNGTSLFSLQFTAIGANGSSTPVSFVQTPTKFEVVNSACLPFDLNHNNGSVTVTTAPPANTVELHAPTAGACPGQTVCLPITVANFNDIAAAQFSLAWDPAVLSFQQVQQYGLPGMTGSNFSTAFTGTGILTFAWFNPNGTGLALPDGAALFEVCFTVTGAAGATSALSFTNSPTAIEMTDGSFGSLPVQLYPGAVSVNACAQVLLSAPQLTSCAGEPLCIPVQVADFQNIASGQFGMSWDPALFSFTGVQNLGLPGLDNSDFNFSATSSGVLTFFWSSGGAGVSLPNNAALFQVCLQPLGPNGSSSAFTITNPVDFIDENFNQVPAVVTNGSVALAPTFTTPACNDLVIYSVADDCLVTLNVDALIEGMCPGAATLTIKLSPSGMVVATGTGMVSFDATPYIGQTLYYEVKEITSGNKCWGSIRIQNVLPVTLSCPPSVTLSCGTDTSPATTGAAQMTGTCLAGYQLVFTDVVIPGNCPQNYTILRTWTVTGASGNTQTCTQVIDVQDNEAPTISCPPDTTVSTDPGSETATVLPDPATATDNCDLNPQITISTSYGQNGPGPHTGVPAGTHTVTYTAVDACGLQSTCSSQIAVPDSADPLTTCDSISAIISPDATQTGCCYVLQLDNQVPDHFAYINLCVLSGGQLSIPLGVPSDWSVQGYTATNAYLVPDSGAIAVGLSEVAYFCLKNIDQPTQVIEIKYYDAQGAVVCRDTFTLECRACVKAIVDSVYCNGWGNYQIDVCIKAGEGLDYLANSVTLTPLGGAVFDTLLYSLPNLAPGDTFCTITVAVSNVAPGQQVCFYAIIHDQDVAAGEPDLNCCADTVSVCFPVPACDPCDSTVTYATAEPVAVPGDSCCWKITLHNPPNFFIGAGTEITTPGMEFGTISNFPGSGWLINATSPFSQSNVWWTPIAPQGGFIQDGYMLPPVCIDEIAPGTGSSPQEIVVSWLGQDSTVCQQTLTVDCLPDDFDCVRVDSAVALCNGSGTLDVTLVITNTTMPPVDAGYIELIPVGAFSFIPAQFYLNLPAGATTTLNTTISGASGSALAFLITLHQLNHDSLHLNCCNLQDTLHLDIRDATPPTCTPPLNVTVNCENFDPTLAAYGAATGTDDCCFDALLTTNVYTLFDTLCNKGTIVRRFTSLDCAGNTATCAHRIIVRYTNDYYVKFPDDVFVTACDGSGDYGAPVFYGEDCELLATVYEDELNPVVPDACFAINRTWTVVNWCTYNPNLGCTVVPNPRPSPITNNPNNLVGPVVSAPGNSVPGWAPTVVAITPGATPTNFSTFWSTSVNCYQYTQIIKIIDNAGPQISNCPAGPQTVCDFSGNDTELWNETYWTDPVYNTHDLLETAVNLELTATDQCVGADITFSYVLFLDLDNDGSMETAVPSANLPGYNNIQFGNANTPGYSGGTPRAFDERPVGVTEKWGFGLQVDPPSGANRTARVRWFNQAGQNAVPQLPRGTHKIKWTVMDNCGNESVCEYVFTVTDCAPPTILCTNGLSVNLLSSPPVIFLWSYDFIQTVSDNYTPSNQVDVAIRRSGTGSGFPTGQANVVFDCDDLGIQLVDVWGMDKAGNANYCQTFVVVQDNSGLCSTPAPVPADFQVFQNQPNPWTDETQIPVYLPEAMSATLTVFDAMGRRVYTSAQAFEQGLQYFSIGNGAIQQTGALYYQVETAAGTVKRLMLRE